MKPHTMALNVATGTIACAPSPPACVYYRGGQAAVTMQKKL
jgi:hypothetical protein